jgi:hypothetical protein
VANDTVDNFLYLNRSAPGRIRLEEVGMSWGVARDERGLANGSMGVDAADFDGTGRPSLWVTAYEDQMHALYRNLGPGQFLFGTPGSGIAAIGQSYVGWGTGFLDLDNHGWEDLVVANGHVMRHPRGGTPRQRPVLLRNRGAGRYVDVTSQGGDYFRGGHRGRGVAIGDLDNDGRPDLVISHVNEPVILLRNEAGRGRHWLGVELSGAGHRDLVGTRVVVEAGGRRQTRFVKGGGSYCSSGDRRPLFGLGAADHFDGLRVRWPSGREQHWVGGELAVDRYWRLTEGQDRPVPIGSATRD